MAPITRRTISGGISKAPLRKSKSRDDSFSSSGVGLATSALRADADAALQSRPDSKRDSFAVKAPSFPSAMTNGVNGTNGVHDALQPLSSMAERVGREVEDFAEQVDRWRTKLETAGADGGQKYKATIGLVDKLQNIAERRLSNYQNSRADTNGRSTSRNSLAGLRPAEAEARMKDAQQEVDTWKLFRITLEDQFSDPDFDPAASLQQYRERKGDLTPYTPGSEIWERFLLDNSIARGQNAVLNWLEETAQTHGQTIDTILDELESRYGTGTSSLNRNWLYTQNKVKAEKRERLADDAMETDALDAEHVNGIVSQLDPDAPTRQMRPLDPKDMEQEKAVAEACFQMLRTGLDWAEITEWLNDRGENWRAVSLGIACDEQSARTNVEGPDYGTLFRKVCFAVARAAETPAAEKALYGLRAGDLLSSLRQCKSWDDHIYVYFNALLLDHFRQWLQENVPQALQQVDEETFPSPTPIEAMGELFVGADIVNSLEAKDKTRAEAITPIKQIQGALIAKRFTHLAYAVGLGSASLYTRQLEKSHMMPPANVEVDAKFSAVFENETAVRLCVHFAMIMEALQPGTEHTGKFRPLDRVIICYLDFLRRAGKFETLPTYAVYMDTDQADKVLGMMCADIANPEEQRTLINLIDQNGMKAVDALWEQVHFALDTAELGLDSGRPILEYELVEKTDALEWPGFRIRAEHAATELEPKEEKIIRALEWYTVVDGQLWGILNLLAVVYRSFLVNRRYSAALALTERISYKTLLALKTPHYYGKIIDFMDADAEIPTAAPVQNFRRSTRASSRQPDGHPSNDFDGETHGEPERVELFHKLFRRQGQTYYELMQLTLALKALSDWRVAEQQAISDLRSGSRRHKESKKALGFAYETVCAAVHPVLRDFLTHPRDNDENRDLELIRKVYLPEVMLAYVSVCHFAGLFLGRESGGFTRALDVASVVAGEGNKELRDAFVGLGKMEDLVRELAAVSRTLLRVNEQAAKAGKRKDDLSSKRGWDGRTVDIWDLNRTN